ncbi:MAG: response regulator transcription factor [Fimbriimonadaceae bacterium]|nr:MAG: response regulator transcription factor [Fimbriimonadaceae bacterium]
MIAASAGGKNPPKGPQSVLVADSERHLVRMIQVNLQRQGHHITCAFSLEEVFNALRNQSFDICIFGEMLHPKGGIALLEELSIFNASQKTPNVLITSKGREEDFPKMYELGANLILTRPINPAELLNLL